MNEELIEETQSEETTSQETEEQNLETEVDTTTEGESEVASDDTSAEALKAELAKTKEQNAKLFARLKKAEAKDVTKTVKSGTNSSLTREEAILFAKGHTEEEVNLAVKLAKVSGTNILVAVEDPYFKSKVNDRLKKEKSEQASLGASKSGNKFTHKNVGAMSEDEHAKLFHEVMSRV